MSRPLTAPQREALIQIARGEVCTARAQTLTALRVAGLRRDVEPVGLTPRGAEVAAEAMGLHVDVAAWEAALTERDEAAHVRREAWLTLRHRCQHLYELGDLPRVTAALVAHDAARERHLKAVAAEEAARRAVLAVLRAGGAA